MTSDEQKEDHIHTYRVRMIDADTRSQRVYWWERMRAEILTRSPQQVAKMEKEQGLT